MADRNELIQRYSDLLDSELDDDELQAVALLDAAAAPYRQIEPPVSLDRAVERFVRQRRAPALNGASIEPVPSETARYSSSPSRLPTRMRTGWLRQGLGMVAAVLAVALLAGVLAVTFRNQGGDQQGGLGGGATATDAVAVPTPDASGQYHNLSFAQAQQIAPFHLVQPAWVPSYLVSNGIDARVRRTLETPNGTPAIQPASPEAIDSVSFAFGPRVRDNGAVVMIQETPDSVSFGSPPQDAVMSTLMLVGQTITKFEYDSNLPIAGYQWRDQGTGFELKAYLDGQLTEQDVEHMIASMLEQSNEQETASTTVSVPATPNPSGASSFTFEEVQQLAPFYVAQPTWMPSYLETKYANVPFGPGSATPATPVVQVTLWYGPPVTAQLSVARQYFVELFETDQPSSFGFPGNPTPTTVTVSGHAVARVEYTNNGPYVNYQWQDQGTIFSLDAKIAGPLTEQDIEHMIASMLTPDSGASTPPAAATTASGSAALTQADAIWSQVVKAINGGIDPILKPSQLPDGFDTIKLESITPTDGSFGGPPSFDVQYSGQGKTTRHRGRDVGPITLRLRLHAEPDHGARPAGD